MPRRNPHPGRWTEAGVSLETTLSTAVSSGEDKTVRNNIQIRPRLSDRLVRSGGVRLRPLRRRCFARSPACRRWQAVDVRAPQMAAAARKCQTKTTGPPSPAVRREVGRWGGAPCRCRSRLLAESRSTGGGGGVGVGKEETIALVDVDRGLMPRTVRGHPPPGPSKPRQTPTMTWTWTSDPVPPPACESQRSKRRQLKGMPCRARIIRTRLPRAPPRPRTIRASSSSRTRAATRAPAAGRRAGKRRRCGVASSQGVRAG